jgi:hypothetical protein
MRNKGSNKKRDGGRGRRWQQGDQPPAGDAWRDCAGNQHVDERTFRMGTVPNLTDRTTLAVLHALVDPAAAGIIAAGLMFRWEWRRQGIGFLAFAVLLIAYSMLSVFGFMSTRIAATQSHSATPGERRSSAKTARA